MTEGRATGSESGMVTILVVVLLMAIVNVVAMGFVFGLSSRASVARGQLQMEQARYVAEGGAESAAAYIGAGGSIPTVLTGTVGTASFVARVVLTNVVGSAARAYVIRSVGTVQGKSRTITVEGARNKTWAKYALWSDNNRSIYFKSGERFDGPVHSNTKLWFSGNPEFLAEVTSAVSDYGGSTNQCIFRRGFIRPVPTDTMASVDFAALKAKSALTVTGTTTIVFQGTNALVSNAGRGWTARPVGVSTTPVIYVATAGAQYGRVSVRGALDGRVTVAADQDIEIVNNLTYTSDPLTNAASDDALGLISGRDIVVKTSFPDNGSIYAHMIATGLATGGSTDGSFGVESYSTRHPSGFLKVCGGIVQSYRGAVGTFSGSTLTSGFDKRYTYDSRFAIDPPPEYPMLSDELTWTTWREGG